VPAQYTGWCSGYSGVPSRPGVRGYRDHHSRACNHKRGEACGRGPLFPTSRKARNLGRKQYRPSGKRRHQPKAKVARFQDTKPPKRIVDTRRKLSTARCRQHASATLTGLRTHRVHLFRMKGRFAFRMKQKNKKRPTLTNCTAKWKAGWERSPYRTGLRGIGRFWPLLTPQPAGSYKFPCIFPC
jgi:hypothetical protein